MKVVEHVSPDREDAYREPGNGYRDHHREDHSSVQLLLVDHQLRRMVSESCLLTVVRQA
jgi:hypothetical protein